MLSQELSAIASRAARETLVEMLESLPTRPMIMERLGAGTFTPEQVDRYLDLYNLIPEDIDHLTVREAHALAAALRPWVWEIHEADGAWLLTTSLD